jgi:hypothetical protein
MTPFNPGGFNNTIAQANATSSAGGSLPDTAAQVALYNSSSTATAYFVCRVLNSPADAGPTAVVPSGGTLGAMPVPPGQQIRVTVARGPKKYATIASAADGTLFITPGEGN